MDRQVIEPRRMSDRRTEVVCDTTAYLPDELVTSRGIHRVSLYVGLEGELKQESEISNYAEFYEGLRTSKAKVTTSQPSVGDFVEIYEPLLEAGKDVVSIHISAGISGTCEAAAQARDRLDQEGKGGERIRIYNSRTGAGGLGLCVLAATVVADTGAGGNTVLQRVVETRDSLKIWFALDTLEYLRRGDRIGKARGWLGSTLRIKPILTLEEEITPVERVRTRSRALERLRGYARQRHESGADAWVVQYIQDRETAEALIDDCREIFGREPVFISEVGPVIGAHIGPGLLGVGSVPESVLT
jgi:DegV family protein with EDD domain